MEFSQAFHRRPLVRNIIARPRLIICVGLGLLSILVMPGSWHLPTRLLLAWNIGVVFYICAAILLMVQSDPRTIRRQALLTDEGRFVVLILACVSVAACFVAILLQLAEVKDTHGLLRAGHLTLAAGTVISAWTFTHIIFAQHYAHEYFIERASERELPEEFRGGLCFPGTQNPDFYDFLYFSFVIGVASQTADVEICSRPMRRVSLAHSLVSFFFNTTIVALTINIASGLVSN
jgi:uncharacterized membrane protein